ncbi:DUF4328 domain-containing protein [Streptomyces spongiae]|nr:DUF4328 domain-containing protein [Streptomyces spongiae]
MENDVLDGGRPTADPRPLAVAAQALIAAQTVAQSVSSARYASVSVALFVAAVVVFLCWFRRCRLNAEVFAPGTHRYAPGFAVGGWFIPVAMWWIPRRTALDIWRASGPAGGEWLINAWWVAWLAKAVGTATAHQFASRPGGSFLYDQVTGVVVGVLAILVIGRVTARQHAGDHES